MPNDPTYQQDPEKQKGFLGRLAEKIGNIFRKEYEPIIIEKQGETTHQDLPGGTRTHRTNAGNEELVGYGGTKTNGRASDFQSAPTPEQSEQPLTKRQERRAAKNEEEQGSKPIPPPNKYEEAFLQATEEVLKTDGFTAAEKQDLQELRNILRAENIELSDNITPTQLDILSQATGLDLNALTQANENTR